MKLIETDIPDHEDDLDAETVVPPRPPRRRVAVSLLLTVSLLASTVGVIFLVFPKRDNEILTVAMESHVESESAADFELQSPNAEELRAWTIGVLGRTVPWPGVVTGSILGVRQVEVFRRPMAQLVVELGGERVSVLALRARDTPPRLREKIDEGLYARSWRRKKWTLIAVGREDTRKIWLAALRKKR